MHKPVMLNEVLELLVTCEGGTYIDGTLCAGGHARPILERLTTEGRLMGIDRDAEILEHARQELTPWKSQCFFEHGNFADMDEIAGRRGIKRVDGVLLDLGISSFQINESNRGFSFMNDGPLDMRMDRTQKMTATDIIRSATVEKLAELIRTLGEESCARRIARAIVSEREHTPDFTTRWLSDLVIRATGGRRGRIHPATRTFQALRMAVNREMECLDKGIEAGIAILKQGGRMAVLSYHSLEDRSVKEKFRQHVGQWESHPSGGRRWLVELPAVRLVNKKPLRAMKEEVASNPRARSAKLRVLERIE